MIGIVLPYLKSRGTEKQALRLASGFIERGAGVVLFVVQGWGLESMYRAFENAGIRVVNVGPAIDEGKKKIRFHRVFQLARLIRSFGCTVLLSRAGMTNQITGFAGLLTSIPTAVVLSGASVKEETLSVLKKWIASLRLAIRLGFPNRIISVSNEGASNFSLRYPALAKKVKAVPNGVDRLDADVVHKQPFLNSSKFYFCYSGSLEINRKGIDVLVDALKVLVLEYGVVNAGIVLIGAGQDENQIKSSLHNKGLDDHVMFAGEQSEPYALMSQCQAFVLPSRKEGLPNALLEAMSLGMCAIATDCDTGPREIITHGVDGLLVPPDDHRRLAEAMSKVMHNKMLREELGNQAKITIEKKFSLEKMIDGYFELLTERK